MESTPSLSPISALKHSISAVPEVKYALGITGIAAAVAITLGFVSDIRIAVFGVLIALALMYLLAIFTQVLANISGLRWLATFLVWTITILFLSALVMVFTSYAFGIPEILANRLFNAAVTHREAGGVANVDVGLYDEYGEKREWDTNFVPDSTQQSDVVTTKNNEVSREVADQYEGNILKYVHDRVDEKRIQIKPEMPYLSLLQQKGPITDYPRCLFTFPKLSINVVNNTSRTLVISEVAIDIRSSHIITLPILSVFGSDSLPATNLYFHNEGWGDLLNPTVEYDLTGIDSCKNPYLERKKYTRQLPTIESSTSIDISQEISDFKNSHPAETKQGWVCVFGKVRYGIKDGVDRVATFATEVAISQMEYLKAFPTHTYDVFLEGGRDNYVRRLPVAHELKAGESDLFLLRVATNKWAQFDLGFSFRTTEGIYLAANDVLIEIFVPRSESKLVFFKETPKDP